MCLVASLIAAMGCSRRARPSPSEPALAHAPQRAGARPATHRGPGLLGVLVAPQTVDVTSQLEGRVLAIAVHAGDRVASGAPLARLDTRSARQELAMAAADLAAAEAERQRARLELAEASERVQRRETLVQLPSRSVSTVSGEELSTARYQQQANQVKLAAADATVAQRRAHLEQLRILLSEGVLRAPFAGVVVARYCDAGSTVRKGTAIVRLLESGELRARFAVPEEAAERVTVAMPVRLTVGDTVISGTVDKVAPEVDAASRLVFAEASLHEPRATPHLRSGQVVRIYLDDLVASKTP
jgi:RND family efflux transporter MFP subunit